MATIQAFIKRHPVVAYFTLTFAISWGGVLLVIGGPGAIPADKEQIEALSPIAFPVLLLGPCIAGMVLTGLVHGRAGFRGLLSRLFRWRVGPRWYAAALLTTPLLAMAVLLALSRLSSDYTPIIFTTDDKAALLLTGIVAGLVGGGVFEELGWTGFAVPALRRRCGALATGFIVGVLWGVWHLLTHAWSIRAYSGTVSLDLFRPVFLFAGALQLTAYRMLMAWVYDRTGGSLPVAMLLHASHTASTVFVLMPAQATGAPLLAYVLALAAGLWIIVGGIAVAESDQRWRQELRSRPALSG